MSTSDRNTQESVGERISQIRERIQATRIGEEAGQKFWLRINELEAEKDRIRRDLEVRLAVHDDLSRRGLVSRVMSWLQGGP